MLSYWIRYAISANLCCENLPVIRHNNCKMGVNLFCCRNQKISNNQVKLAAKNIKANFIACELSLQRIVTFDVVLYRNQ